MSKKYLSLDEAASMLGMPREEITRLREKGELRGFADRGTWKFKVEDVENLGRSRQADSDPEVPLMLDDSESGDAILIDEDDVPDLLASDSAPSDSSADRALLSNSDSDVRLILDDELADVVKDDLGDSDSDVKLVGDVSDSDSDVKLVGAGDSDVKLSDDATLREISMPDSDSDVKLAMPDDDSGKIDRSDSDVQLLPDGGDLGHASDSDVAILGSDSAVSLDFGDAARSESVLPDDIDLGPTSSGILSGGSGVGIRPNDSGIALDDDEDEGITLASPSGPGSGINLADDSGISLSAADSGISLSAADSGISLEAVADSGISLEDSHDFTGTVPMMNVVGDDDEGAPTTKFELPSMEEDSAFEIKTNKGKGKKGKKDTEETGVLEISDDEGSLDDAVFDVDDEVEGSAADLDVSDDLVEDDEEVEELDVFDADEAFEGGEEEDLEAAPVGRRMVAAEPEWGTGMNVFAGLAALASLFCTFIAFDLVKSMWMWGDRPVEPGFFLGLVSKLF
jgi:excisionase family DNA binding protein